MAKEKIAILGGGVGAMATAFELTQSPGWQDKYDITVYQMGWRLGGKGASGRNADMGQRIEEHGLHIWLGFYENAFEMIRLAYDEVHRLGLTPESPFTDFTKVFTKQGSSSMMDGDKIWSFWFPVNNEAPGMNLDQQDRRTPWDDVVSLLHWIAKRWEEAVHANALADTRLAGLHQRVHAHVTTLLGSALWERLSPVQVAASIADKLPRDPQRHVPGLLDTLVEILDNARGILQTIVGKTVAHTTHLRRLFILMDATAAAVRGMIRDGVLTGGYDVVNHWDMKEWLEHHGCRHADLATRAAYDGCFAYENGDYNKRRMEAGTCLRGAMRMMFAHRGAVLWRMNAGMGDTIFSPFYLLLKARGVKFEFFHRVENLGLSADRSTVDHIDFDVQATVKQDVLARQGGYDPLVTIRGIPCWPDRPFYDQLEQGEAMKGFELESAWTTWNSGIPRKRLQRGVDFDRVVLGISLGALPFICRELIEANPKWRTMVEKVGTAQTQAVQLWLKKTAKEMGFSTGLPFGKDDLACLSGYLEPFDTYADMTQTLDKEEWPGPEEPHQVAYFCNVIPDSEHIPAPFTDPDFPAREHQRVKDNALHYLRTSLRPFWPNAVNAAGEIDWDVLFDPTNKSGEARFDSQFWRINIDPSERYVLSLPGSSVHRIPPGESGFANLVLAGDWTFNYINAGCVEAAVISGRLASRALCGHPRKIMWTYGADLEPES